MYVWGGHGSWPRRAPKQDLLCIVSDSVHSTSKSLTRTCAFAGPEDRAAFRQQRHQLRSVPPDGPRLDEEGLSQLPTGYSHTGSPRGFPRSHSPCPRPHSPALSSDPSMPQDFKAANKVTSLVTKVRNETMFRPW